MMPDHWKQLWGHRQGSGRWQLALLLYQRAFVLMMAVGLASALVGGGSAFVRLLGDVITAKNVQVGKHVWLHDLHVERVHMTATPHDCDFWAAPIGNKNCHYEPTYNPEGPDLYVDWSKVYD